VVSAAPLPPFSLRAAAAAAAAAASFSSFAFCWAACSS